MLYELLLYFGMMYFITFCFIALHRTFHLLVLIIVYYTKCNIHFIIIIAIANMYVII